MVRLRKQGLEDRSGFTYCAGLSLAVNEDNGVLLRRATNGQQFLDVHLVLENVFIFAASVVDVVSADVKVGAYGGDFGVWCLA